MTDASASSPAAPKAPVRPRVVIFGLDSATFDLIDPWVAQGDLPNLARLMQMGSRGRLRSTLQPVTAAAWSTFLTGVNQGKHGLYDFVRRKPGEYHLEVTNGTHVSAPNLFEIASQYGLRVAAVNFPYTFPPRPVNGVMVGGPFAPAVSPDLVYPTELFATLQALIPDYFILPDYNPRHADPMRDYADLLLKEIEQRERLGLYLLERESWDVFGIVFMAIDEVQHAFWHCQEAAPDSPLYRYRDVIREVYQRADAALGRMLAALEANGGLDETYIFVVSDHGAGKLRWMINLNHWLADEGLLYFRAARQSWFQRVRSAILGSLAQGYRHFAPPAWRAEMRRRLGMGRFEALKGELESLLLTGAVDWSRTKVYCMGAGGNLFVNLHGREPAGTVQPGAEYEAVLAETIAALQGLKDPDTGQPVVKKAWRREEIYNGPLLEKAPDLIIEWNDYSIWGRGRYDSLAPVFEAQSYMQFTSLPLAGSHRPDGILIASGPGIRVQGEVEGARLLDMAPSILTVLGITPPDQMDGRVLTELFEPTSDGGQPRWQVTEAVGPAAAAPAEETSLTDEEQELISQHLRSLGYL